MIKRYLLSFVWERVDSFPSADDLSILSTDQFFLNKCVEKLSLYVLLFTN